MSLLYLVGPKLNHLSRAAAVTNVTGGDDPLFPITNLYDDQPDVPYRFGLNSANCFFKVDIDLFAGTGAFTTWSAGSPSGWTKSTTGTGAVTQLSPGKDATGSAVRLNAGAAGTALVFKSVTVRAGEMLKLDDLLAFQVAATGLIGVQIYNNSTAKYLQSNGTWSAVQANFVSSGPTAWATSTTSAFQVEAFGGANPERPSLTFSISTSSNANCDVDDVYMYPGVNFGSIHGHNIDSVSPLIAKSTDNFTVNSTTVATMTIARPAFYSSFTMTYARWWGLDLFGTNQAKPYIGEFVLGQAQTAGKAADYGFETSISFPQLRYGTLGRHLHVAGLATDEVRNLHLTFRHTLTMLAELKDEWVRRSQGGLYPMIIVPRDTEAAVYHGRISPDFTHSRLTIDIEDDEVTIEGSPFPTFVG